jgi:hypothetical protein
MSPRQETNIGGNNIMSFAAASRYPAMNVNEPIISQLSEEEFNKLQEIHELINLMLRELQAGAQSAVHPYFMPALAISPYTQTFMSWGMSPYMTTPGF